MKRVGIFCGGFSSEFEISLKSATTILNNFPDNYDTFLVEVRKENWTVIYQNQRIQIKPWELNFPFQGDLLTIDIALIYIHGNPGENGKLQAFFEMNEVPCINSGSLASALSFDKWYCNQFLKGFDIPVAKSLFLTSPSQIEEQFIIEELGLPCFVKPSDSGSSYGISKVNEVNQLSKALDDAFKEGKSVVIEAFLKGTEVTCGVFRNNEGLYALPLTEIVSNNDFFDYEAKYLGASQEITPARVSDEIKEKVQSLTKKIYSLLGLRSIARVDFIVVDEEPFVLEVNTTPGFSPASLVPQMLAHEGISIRDFWKQIIEVELNNI